MELEEELKMHFILRLLWSNVRDADLNWKDNISTDF
jgi:hypothetical protein